MELTAGHLIQLIMVAASVIGAFAIVKNQLARVIQDLAKINDELESVHKRLDTAESSTAVFQHQITVLGRILSPEALEKQHREIANLMARINVAENRIDRNASMHNGKHPPIPNE
jgi:septal ring factor EnvC (AmiA/AmiB activator)